MQPTIQIPQLPQLKPDGTFDTPAVQRFLEDMQKTLRDKQLADYNAYKSLSGSSDVVSADYIIMKDIENLVVHWALVDPLNLDICYQVCDGSAWRSGSYAETFWTPKGLTKIPNLCGYGLRASDRGTTQNDPDRDNRRQAVTGLVLTGGLTVSLPAFYCNVINEARNKGRTVQIGINATDMFGTLSPVSTVTAVDLTTNIVTVTSGSALTVGATKLIIKGDTIGSFQNDAMQKLTGSTGMFYNGGVSVGMVHNDAASIQTGVFGVGSVARNWDPSANSLNNSTFRDLTFDSSKSTSPSTAKTSDSESRIKNISYLPIMWVSPPNSSSLVVDSTLMSIATDTEAQAGIRNDVVLTPYELRKALNAEGSAPVYACRAWVNFNGTGTVAIRASGNVSSVTDDGVGAWTINFTVPMPDVNYAGNVMSTTSQSVFYYAGFYPYSVNQAKIGSYGNGVFADAPYVCVVVFR